MFASHALAAAERPMRLAEITQRVPHRGDMSSSVCNARFIPVAKHMLDDSHVAQGRR
jgi:hypothetical protein